MEKEKFKKGLFFIDCGDPVYEGYTDGTTWKGWNCPFFSEEVSRKIIKDLMINDPEGTFAVYDDINKRYIVIAKSNLESEQLEELKEHNILYSLSEGDLVDKYLAGVFEQQIISIDGEEICVYSLGTGEWPWSMQEKKTLIKKTNLELEGVEGSFQGYTSGQRWNGYECPCFTKEVSIRVLEGIVADENGNTYFYDEKKDRFIVFFSFDVPTGKESEIKNTDKIFQMSTNDLQYHYNAYVYERDIVSFDNKDISVYWIGAFGWIWLER